MESFEVGLNIGTHSCLNEYIKICLVKIMIIYRKNIYKSSSN